MSTSLLLGNHPILRKSLVSALWLAVTLPLAVGLLLLLQGAQVGLSGSLVICGMMLGIVGGLTKISSP